MKAAKILKVVGFVLAGLFVLLCGVPLVLMLAGLALNTVGFFITLAGMLIKLAVIVAFGYLVLVGIKSVMR